MDGYVKPNDNTHPYSSTIIAIELYNDLKYTAIMVSASIY